MREGKDIPKVWSANLGPAFVEAGLHKFQLPVPHVHQEKKILLNLTYNRLALWSRYLRSFLHTNPAVPLEPIGASFVLQEGPKNVLIQANFFDPLGDTTAAHRSLPEIHFVLRHLEERECARRE